MAELPHSARNVSVPPCQWLSLSPGPIFLLPIFLLPWCLGAGRQVESYEAFEEQRQNKEKIHRLDRSQFSQQLTGLPTRSFPRTHNSRHKLHILLSAVFSFFFIHCNKEKRLIDTQLLSLPS